MKRWIAPVCAYASSIAVILILLVSCIDWVCFDRSFYEREYTNLNSAASLHMSQADLMRATDTLLDYLQDERDDIQVTITLYELPKEAFNERERAHMVDVKGLYQFALWVRIAAWFVLLVSISVLWLVKQKELYAWLAVGYARCAVIFVALLLCLGAWAALDFTSLWESFHRLFFTNELWLLNPRTDLMINLFPERFFLHMVLRIALLFVVGFMALFGWSMWYGTKQGLFLVAWRRKVE